MIISLSRINSLVFVDLVCGKYYEGTTGRKVAFSSPNDVTEFFAIYLILPAVQGPGIYSASSRNEYQKDKKICSWGVEHGRCVRPTT
jgi:hypothetical protein